MQKINGLFTILVALAVLLGGAPLSADEKTIRIAGFEWPPYSGKDLKNNGFTTEIVRTAFERSGYRVEYALFPWLRCIKYLEIGKYDVLVNMFYTPERDVTHDYPHHPITCSYYELFALRRRTDIPDTIDVASLRKLRVGLVKSASYGPKFDRIVPELPNIYMGMREFHLLNMLLLDRLDIVPVDRHYASYTLKTISPDRDRVKIVSSDFFLQKQLFPLFSTVPPGHRQFINDYDQAMEKMTADGTVESIHKKHEVAYCR